MVIISLYLLPFVKFIIIHIIYNNASNKLSHLAVLRCKKLQKIGFQDILEYLY
jgi:hypothetical protein